MNNNYNSKVYFITHNPYQSRPAKIIKSLSKRYSVNLIKFFLESDIMKPLENNINSAFRLSYLGFKALFINGPILLDILAGLFFPYNFKRYVVDYRTPLSKELERLGHNTLGKFAYIKEKMLNEKAIVVITPNELIEKYCREMGARKTVIIPNYPTSSFKPTMSKELFRKYAGIPDNLKVALFTAGWRLEKIYGLKLLLNAWRIVEKSLENVLLVIVGPRSNAEMSPLDITNYAKDLGIKNIRVTGWIDNEMLPNWINIADVCLAPRTPGFPSEWYNDKDSTKISEYAALRKPIVAAGYSPSSQYLLVDRTPEAFAEGIMKAFEGKVKPAEPHYWEENEEKIFKAVECLWN